MAFRSIKQVLEPFLIGIKHIFMKPYTIKYPYEGVPNLSVENYRYDPKAGIAYPGYKGRHVLYLDKCTGCSLCDIACLNIAEAITMVYAYNVYVQLDEGLYNSFKSGDPSATEPLEALLLSIQESNKMAYERRGMSHPLMVVMPDMKQFTRKDGMYEFKLNSDPIWEHRSEILVDKYVASAFKTLQDKGWSINKVEDKAPDSEVYEIEKEGRRVRMVVQKEDFKLAHNKKSYFPQVDYGRCVFCGFCVDACPFYALEMSPDVELSALSREGLVYNPITLAGKRISTAPPSLNPIDAAYAWIRNKLRY